MMGVDFCREKTVRCRKDHKCHWCGEAVPAGTEAVYYVCLFDGDFSGSHWHPECWAATLRECNLDMEFPPEYQKRGMTQNETEEYWRDRAAAEADEKRERELERLRETP